MSNMRRRRINGAGIDPTVGTPADELSFARLPDGVRCALKVHGRVVASIDWNRTDVKAARDALSAILRVL